MRRSRGLLPTGALLPPSPVRILIGWLAEEEPPGVNGARDEQARRNGVSSVHDEAAHDEGMEISDG